MAKTDGRAGFDTIFETHEEATAAVQKEAEEYNVTPAALMKSHDTGYASGADDILGFTPKSQIARMSAKNNKEGK